MTALGIEEMYITSSFHFGYQRHLVVVDNVSPAHLQL